MVYKDSMTKLTAHKSSPLKGTITIPGDKSISHRSIMFGALADGTTTITGLLEGEDVMATANAMRKMGAQITKNDNGSWTIQGTAGQLQQPNNVLEMGNSGTSTRLLMGIVAGHDITATFSGDASLNTRPMNRVITPLTQMGARIESSEGGTLPLTVKGSSALKSITYETPIASAQVKSCILLAGLNATGTTTVIENRLTRNYTENMLRDFGINVETKSLQGGAKDISITGGTTLKSTDISVPADPSSAAFAAVAAIITPGSDITLPNIGLNPTRDGLYRTLTDMNADLTITNKRIIAGEPVGDITAKYSPNLTGITVPASRVPDMIDEIPILSIAAACANGTTYMTDLAELRVKESDRLGITAANLKACGVGLEEGETTLTIHGTGTPPKGGTTIATHHDHRIAMAFLALGCATQKPITIDDATPIATSYPTFVKDMNTLGTDIK